MYLMPYDFDLEFKTPFEKLFNSLYSRLSMQNTMSTDIIEKDDNYELVMDLLGFKKENLKIELDQGYLKISATSNVENEEKDSEGKYIRRERRSGSYSRQFFVGENVKQDDIKAKFEDGTLKLKFPKETKKIPETNKFISIE